MGNIPVSVVSSKPSGEPDGWSTEGGTADPFARWGVEFAQRGMQVMPLWQDTKKPMIKEFGGNRHYSEETVRQWAEAPQKAAGNIGLFMGKNRLAVVDIDADDPALLEWVLDELGQSPAIVRTRKGWHVYYRAQNLTGASLRPRHLIDIKAGPADYVLAPGSVREGHTYALVNGVDAFDFLDLLDEIPEPTPDEWRHFTGKSVMRTRAPAPATRMVRSAPVISAGATIQEGDRNCALWRHAMRLARRISVKHGLTTTAASILCDEIQTVNSDCCNPPLDPAEVEDLTRSAWGYECAGKNFIGDAEEGAKRDLIECDYIKQVRGHIRPGKSGKGRAAHFQLTQKVTGAAAVPGAFPHLVA